MKSEGFRPHLGGAGEITALVLLTATLGLLGSQGLEDARVAARYSDTLSDLRMQMRAIECYAVDNADYPRMSWGDLSGSGFPQFADYYQGHQVFGTLTRQVTTPVAYLESYVEDPLNSVLHGVPEPYTYQCIDTHAFLFDFVGSIPVPGTPGYIYLPANRPQQLQMRDRFGEYFVWGVGPASSVTSGNWFTQYDPTNGALSTGNVYLSQNFTQPIQVVQTGL